MPSHKTVAVKLLMQAATDPAAPCRLPQCGVRHNSELWSPNRLHLDVGRHGARGPLPAALLQLLGLLELLVGCIQQAQRRVAITPRPAAQAPRAALPPLEAGRGWGRAAGSARGRHQAPPRSTQVQHTALPSLEAGSMQERAAGSALGLVALK